MKKIIVETAEDERRRRCDKTVSGKHVWGRILRETGQWHTGTYFEVDRMAFLHKCIACEIVDDHIQKE